MPHERPLQSHWNAQYHSVLAGPLHRRKLGIGRLSQVLLQRIHEYLLRQGSGAHNSLRLLTSTVPATRRAPKLALCSPARTLHTAAPNRVWRCLRAVTPIAAAMKTHYSLPHRLCIYLVRKTSYRSSLPSRPHLRSRPRPHQRPRPRPHQRSRPRPSSHPPQAPQPQEPHAGLGAAALRVRKDLLCILRTTMAHRSAPVQKPG